MGFIKKLFGLQQGKKSAARVSKRVPQHELAPVSEIIEQGLLVADVAIKMTVKNEIIMNAMKHKRKYSESEACELVKKAIADLQLEREVDAARVSRMRDEIQIAGYAATGEANFGALDRNTLRHREEVYEGLAGELAERAENIEYVNRCVAAATELAWKEIGDSLKEKASHPYYAGGRSAAYQRVREQRIKTLIEHDLKQLINGESDPPPAHGVLAEKSHAAANGALKDSGFLAKVARLFSRGN